MALDSVEGPIDFAKVPFVQLLPLLVKLELESRLIVFKLATDLLFLVLVDFKALLREGHLYGLLEIAAYV